MIAAEVAIQSWVNSVPGLTGDGNPLALGAYLRQQRSPGAGAYAVISRVTAGAGDLVAERDASLDTARIQCQVFAGTEDAAEQAAAAYASAVQALTGSPVPCGDPAGTLILVSDTITTPMFLPASTEQYCFQVSADYTLYQPPDEEAL